MIRAFQANVLALFVLILIAGCTPETKVHSDVSILEDNNRPETIAEYHIGVDDTINVNVWRNAELTVTVPVRPDGKISMPLIGDVHAAGLAPEYVAKSIENKLKNFVRDPNVTVMATGLQSNEYLTRIRITGAVGQPTSMNYRQGMTVLDAILSAGSINDFASGNSTKLYRKINGKMHVITIKLEDILEEGDLETNIGLRPGDIITVPERLF